MSTANPQFNAYTTTVLEYMLVSNPASASFPIGINGGAIANGSAATTYQDVTRQQILNEIANRVADEKVKGVTPTRVLVDFASPVGANDPQPVPGTPNYVLTASQVK